MEAAVTQELNVPNILAMTARLAQVMAQEADLLAAMKISEIEPLQKEKNTLARALEAQLKKLRQYPELRDAINDDEQEDLRELIGVFNEIRDENMRRLLSAKEVNQKVVEAITEVVNEQNRKPTYTEDGANDTLFDSLSVTLNKTI